MSCSIPKNKKMLANLETRRKKFACHRKVSTKSFIHMIKKQFKNISLRTFSRLSAHFRRFCSSHVPQAIHNHLGSLVQVAVRTTFHSTHARCLQRCPVRFSSSPSVPEKGWLGQRVQAEGVLFYQRVQFEGGRRAEQMSTKRRAFIEQYMQGKIIFYSGEYFLTIFVERKKTKPFTKPETLISG